LSSKPRETANVGAGLWKATGMWAWVLFRISGLVLVLYLFVHIGVISTGRFGTDGSTLNSIMEFFENPLAILLDLLLVWAVLYHALNGVRIVLMDFGLGIQKHKAVFWVVMAIAVVCVAFFAWVAIDHLLEVQGVIS
jgi:succinate dehydrogenase / fumarate reductase, cytochrome b subunit